MPSPAATVPMTASQRDSRSASAGRDVRDRRILDAAAIVVLLALALAAVLPTVLRGLPFSVYDEATHLDYAWRVSQGEVPARGDDIAPEILDAWGCYGSEFYSAPACTLGAPADDYPNEGSQYNFGHPPLYYAITGVLARGIVAVTDLDFVTAARSTGALWMFAGMTVLMLGVRRLGVERWLAVASAAAAGMWWTTYSASVYVSNDAPALLVAGSVVLLVARLMQGSVPWMWTAAIAVLASSTKVMSGLVVLAFAGLCLLLAIWPRLRPVPLSRGRLWLAAIGGVGGVLGVFGAWAVFQGRRGDPDWENPIHGISGDDIISSPFDEWLSTAFDGFASIGQAIVSSEHAYPPMIIVLAQIAAIAVLAATFIALAKGGREPVLRLLGIIMVLGLAAWPMIVQGQMYRSTEGEDFFRDPSGRYALTMPPVAIGTIALLTTHSGRARAIAIIGFALFVVATLLSIWTAHA